VLDDLGSGEYVPEEKAMPPAAPSVPAPLLFPCLICSSGLVLRATRKQFLKFHCAGHCGGNVFLFKFVPGPAGRRTPAWVLDRTGGFREIRVRRIRRRWAAPLRLIWDFTLAECEVLDARYLPAGQMLDKLGDLKGRPPFQVAGHLRGFLKAFPPDRVFDETSFRGFWDQFSYQVEASEWQEQYP